MKEKTVSIAARLRKLINTVMIPLFLFSAVMVGLLAWSGYRSSAVTHNITTASGFNQNFKAEVDLKTYCYVAGSEENLPYEEVAAARSLAQTLLESTGNRDSRRTIAGVINLCDNLEGCLNEVRDTAGYDERMQLLETDIYIITQLIEEYVYNYLYYEAGQLATLQAQQNSFVLAATVAAAVLMLAIVITASLRSNKTAKSITRPLDELYARVSAIGKGDLTPLTPVAADDEKLQALSEGIEKMVRRINTQLELNEQKQIQLREMELQLIQAQINPHFLYNTLDTIVWLIETGKPEKAQEMVGSLSNYFRSFLSKGRDIITIGEELLHVRSYLEIQQVRYKDILRYDIQADSRFDSCRIPKMTLQPLVENAIYHGIKLKRGGGSIRVLVRPDGERVLLQVKDTGAGMTNEQLNRLRVSLTGEGEGFGLLASYKRLLLRYGERCSFEIESAPGEGTTITIRIPPEAEEAEA